MRYVHCFVRVVGCGFPLVGFIGGWVVIGRGGGELVVVEEANMLASESESEDIVI